MRGINNILIKIMEQRKVRRRQIEYSFFLFQFSFTERERTMEAEPGWVLLIGKNEMTMMT